MKLVAGLIAALALNVSLMADDKKEEKFDATKLIGKWKYAEKKGNYPAVIEFRKNGTITATVTVKDEKYNLEVKYRTEGNKVVIVLRDDKEHDEVYIVNKLTDTDLVWTAEKDKEQEMLTRLKDK